MDRQNQEQQHINPYHTKQNKRIRLVTKFSPVESQHDFHRVGQALISVENNSDRVSSDNTLTVEQALEQIQVWRIHQPRLPHAVESTAALAEVFWRDFHNSRSPCELQHGYASGILRAINGLADTLQQHRSTASSIAILCDSLGIPSWLVDIRHQATHQQMPSLPVLRLAASTLLRYFATVYWLPLAERHEALYNQAFGLLEAYERAAIITTEKETTTPTVVQEEVSKSSAASSSSDEDVSLQDRLIPKVGSNTNRFALLMDTKKKKKKQEPIEVPRKKQKKSPAKSTDTSPTPCSCAIAYIKDSKIPIDIAYDAAIDFMVRTDRQAPSTYRTLVTEMGRAWPGFLMALQRRSQLQPDNTPVIQQLLASFCSRKVSAHLTDAAPAKSTSLPNMWQQCREWEPSNLGELSIHYRW